MSTAITGADTRIGNDRVAEVLSRTSIKLDGGTLIAEPVANMIRLPAGHEEYAIDYHGVARDSLGRIYILYNSFQRFPYTRTLARFHYKYDEATDTGRCVFDTFIGTRDWAEGTMHGLNISRVNRDDGLLSQEYIALVNNDGTVQVSDLDGNVVWRRMVESDGPTKPTSAIVTPHGNQVGLVDGYGTNRNFLYDIRNGTIIGSTGSEGSADGQSRTNHGIDLDPAGNFVVADRSNKRLTWWTADSFEPILRNGSQVQLPMPGLEVCSVSFLRNQAVVPCLNATLAFLASSTKEVCGYEVAAIVTMPQELIDAGIDGVHDADFTPDGRYVIVGVWERNRNSSMNSTLTAFRIRSCSWLERHRGNSC